MSCLNYLIQSVINIINSNSYMQKPKANALALKKRYEFQLQQFRTLSFDLIKLKLQKRKIDINKICDKKDVHNLLNSFLQGNIFEEDLLNQFWTHYFKHSATLIEIMKVYIDTIIMIIQKIVNNNQRKHQISIQKVKYKQNNDFSHLNAVTEDFNLIKQENQQFIHDLKDFCLPFNLNALTLIDKFNSQTLKEKATTQREEIEIPKQLPVEKEMDNILQDVKKQYEEKSQSSDANLTNQQKYYRFIVYVNIMLFVIELSLVYSKYNFIDLFFTLILLNHSLMENYLWKQEEINKIYTCIQINYVENKLSVREEKKNGYQFNFEADQQKLVSHSFQYYVYSCFSFLILMIVWDCLWLILMHQTYYFSNELSLQSYNPLTIQISIWKYHRFILYASIFSLLAKIIVILLLLKVIDFQWEKAFNRYNLYIPFLRFTNFQFMFSNYED